MAGIDEIPPKYLSNFTKKIISFIHYRDYSRFIVQYMDFDIFHLFLKRKKQTHTTVQFVQVYHTIGQTFPKVPQQYSLKVPLQVHICTDGKSFRSV